MRATVLVRSPGRQGRGRGRGTADRVCTHRYLPPSWQAEGVQATLPGTALSVGRAEQGDSCGSLTSVGEKGQRGRDTHPSTLFHGPELCHVTAGRQGQEMPSAVTDVSTRRRAGPVAGRWPGVGAQDWAGQTSPVKRSSSPGRPSLLPGQGQITSCISIPDSCAHHDPPVTWSPQTGGPTRWPCLSPPLPPGLTLQQPSLCISQGSPERRDRCVCVQRLID